MRLGGGLLASSLLLLLCVIWMPGLVAGQLPKWMVLFACLLWLPFIRIQWDRIAFAVMAFIGWLGLSVAWSDDPMQALHQFHRVLVFAFLFFAGRQYGEKWLVFALPVAVAGSLIVGVTQGFYGSWGNENFATEFFLLAIPFLFLAAISHSIAAGVAVAWLLVAVFAYLMWLPSRIEFVVLYGAFLGLVWWKARGLLVFAIAIPVAVLFLSDSVWGLVEGSALARAELWINSAHMWLESPLWGQGFGSFNYEYPRFASEHLAYFDRVEVQIGHHAGAAHNDYLQLLCETGLIGFLLGMGCLWLILSRAALSASLVLVGIAGVMCLIGFPAQMPVTGALLFYCLGCVSRSETCGLQARSGEPVFSTVRPTSTLHPTRWGR